MSSSRRAARVSKLSKCLLGDYLYGTGGAGMLCVQFSSGDVKWEDRALGAASLFFADGRLYLHGENGEVALVEPSTEGYREKSRFAPPQSISRPAANVVNETSRENA